MFQFHWPWISLFIPLPFLILRFFPSSTESEIPKIYFPALNRLKDAFTSNYRQKEFSWNKSSLLLSLVWVLLILALMRPEEVDQYQFVKNKGYDLLLAVDTSASMQAVDFSTSRKVMSRLDVTKEVVGKFVLQRQGDRVGLILFGENAYLHVPLTLDTLSVSHMLNDMVSGVAGNATAIGDAIGLSVKTLRNRPKESRVLILLTDGEDNASNIPPLEAAKLAKQYGIKIYTIGIGKKGQAPFPNGRGGYSVANVSIDEKLLKEIAEMTGGHFYMAADRKGLESIYEQINLMEKSESNESLLLFRKPLYHYPLGMAVILFLLLSLTPLIKWKFSYAN